MTTSSCFSAQKEFTRTDSRCPTRGENFNLFWRSKDHVEKLILDSLCSEPRNRSGLSGSCTSLKIPGTVTALMYRLETAWGFSRQSLRALGELDMEGDRLLPDTLRNCLSHSMRHEAGCRLARRKTNN